MTNGGGKRVENLSCGLELECCPSIFQALNSVKDHGFEFIVIPFIEPLNITSLSKPLSKLTEKCELNSSSIRDCCSSRADLTLDASDWSSLVVCRVSGGFIQCDSPDVAVQRKSEEKLLSELNYASYLNVPAVLIPLNKKCNANLARIVHNFCLGLNHFIFWIELPLLFQEGDELDSWKSWNELRMINNYSKRLALILRVTADLPSQELWRKWIAEPVKCLIIDVDVFQLSKSSAEPCLSEAHRKFIRTIVNNNPAVQMVLSGSNTLPDGADLSEYYGYLNTLWKDKSPIDTIQDHSTGWENYLQIPLQPLQDNLESCTYEIFEKDPVKYPKYQDAIELALKDKLKSSDHIVMMVLGAGRGPLVRCAIAAAKLAGCADYTLYAVEKNPNAVVTLDYLKQTHWGDTVRIVSQDMRDVELEDKADIVISELLGSFGDNELSPECLDGATRLMKPDAISIPSSYRSHIVPISSHVLHTESLNSRELDKAWDACLETPYVVRLVNYQSLAETRKLFEFHHPNRDANIDNTRQAQVDFVSNDTSVINGIAGYFDTTLYKDIELSIVPKTHSEGMFSWFPIYFPLKNPVAVTKGETISVHFWRCLNKHKVWYEWCLSEPLPTAIHNPNGRSYFIGK